MPNAMKAKGDREERAVLEIIRPNGFPDAERTRAGRMEDQGDIHMCWETSIAPGVICAVKDTKVINWSQFLGELDEQLKHSGADVGFLSLKRSRPGKAPLRVAALPLEDMLYLLRMAGYGTPIDPEVY